MMYEVKRGGSARNANMEMLRVIAMLMIIAHHMVYYSGLLNIQAGINRYAAQLFNMGGKMGVNLFVMIGAWHMCMKEYSLRRTVRIWLQTVVTGVLLLLGCGWVWGWERIGNAGSAFRQMLLPVSQTGYWFAGTYVILTLLMPFLNVLLRSVGRRGVDVLLGVLTFAMSVIPTVYVGKYTYFSPIFWFVYLYLLIGRLRRWRVPKLARHGMKIFVLGTCGIFLSTLLLGCLKEKGVWNIYDSNYYANRMEVLPMLLASLGLFMSCVRRKPYSNRAAEMIGQCCFGVYLIHDHPYLRSHIWGEMIRAGGLAQSPMLLLYMPLAVAVVFVAAVLLELIRQNSVGRLENWLLYRIEEPMKRFDEMLGRELRATRPQSKV